MSSAFQNKEIGDGLTTCTESDPSPLIKIAAPGHFLLLASLGFVVKTDLETLSSFRVILPHMLWAIISSFQLHLVSVFLGFSNISPPLLAFCFVLLCFKNLFFLRYTSYHFHTTYIVVILVWTTIISFLHYYNVLTYCFHSCQHRVCCPFDSHSALVKTNQIMYFPTHEKNSPVASCHIRKKLQKSLSFPVWPYLNYPFPNTLSSHSLRCPLVSSKLAFCFSMLRVFSLQGVYICSFLSKRL